MTATCRGTVLKKTPNQSGLAAPDDYRRLTAAEPGNSENWRLLGVASFHAGNPAGAIEALRQAIALAPRDAATHETLAIVHAAAGKTRAAISGLRRAVRLEAPGPTRLRSLAVLLARDGAIEDALALYQRIGADEMRADTGIRIEKARLLRRAGQVAEAAEEYEILLRDGHRSAEVWGGLGAALIANRQYSRAVAVCESGLAAIPRNSALLTNLGAALAWCGRLSESISALREGLLLSPRNPKLISNYLSALAYASDLTPKFVFEEHVRYGQLLGPGTPAVRKAVRSRQRKNGRLRVGYLSPDLRNHVVSFFIEPILAAHDRDRVHVTCYSDAPASDSRTHRLRPLCDGWRNTFSRSDDDLARMVVKDRIDVLVELVGHSANNRLTLFGRRVAPVQATYLGYPGTTGVREMDLRLTDNVMDPPGSEAFHTERLARLNRCPFSFSRPGCVAPEQKGGARTGFTFASFNQLFKITGPLLRAWAAIVSACAEARLLIVSRSLSDAEVRSAFLERCLQAGIDPARLELQGFVADPEAHNARLAGADAILDTFPYNGATTTCEALLLGVPVVVLRGDSSAGRQGATILEASGLREFVAESTVEYARIAQSLYERRRTLPELRQMVQSRMKRSPVVDGASLARAIEEAQWAAFEAAVPRLDPATPPRL